MNRWTKKTEDYMKAAKERENEKAILAYQTLKKIGDGRTYLEVRDILDRMEKQLSSWISATPCRPSEYALDRHGYIVWPPVEETTDGADATDQ